MKNMIELRNRLLIVIGEQCVKSSDFELLLGLIEDRYEAGRDGGYYLKDAIADVLLEHYPHPAD